MRKKICAFALSCLLALSICIIALNSNDDIKADAANIKLTEMVDTFDSDKLNSDAWTVNGGVEFQEEYTALKMSSQSWGRHVTLQEMPLNDLWGDFYIEFDISWLNAERDWTGLTFGNISPNGEYTTAKYMLYFNFVSDNKTEGSTEPNNTRGIRLSPKKVGESGFETTYGKSVFNQADIVTRGNLQAGGSAVRVRLEFTAISGDGDNSHSLALQYGVVGQSFGAKLNFNNMNVKGYLGFTAFQSQTIEIDNFKLYGKKDRETDESFSFDDNFDNSSLSVPSSPSSSAIWRSVGADLDLIYCGKFCSISFENVKEGSLVYTNPISKNPLSDKTFEMNYEVRLAGITENTYIGSGFALSSLNSKADEVNYIGMRLSSAGKYKLALIKNGVLTGSEVEFSLSGIKASLKFVGFYDNSVGIYINSSLITTFKNVNFDGNLCIGAVTLNGIGEGNDTDIDTFSLYTYESVEIEANSMGINFQGRKEYELFGDVVKEHYYNTRKWVMYGGVRFPIQDNRSYIMFADIKYDVGFAPKARFGDTITRFDFRPSSLPELDRKIAPFGYSFGRDYLDATYGESQGVYFERTETGTTRVYARNMKTKDGGEGVVLTDKNVFESINTWYTCLIIVSNRTAKVYLKPTEADDSEFGSPVITFVEVNSFGYVALTIDGKDGYSAYYNATNFSITSIDPLMTGGN